MYSPMYDPTAEREGFEPSLPHRWTTLSRTPFSPLRYSRSARDRSSGRGTEGSTIALTAPYVESHDPRRRSGPTLELLLRPLLNQGSYLHLPR
jgi:hypothetical protein